MDTITRSARRMSAAERRIQLLEVTKAMVGAEGFHAVTIEAVARRAGVSRPVVYEHFGDLHGLLDALIDLLSHTALEQLAAVLPTDLRVSKPSAVLLAALRGYLEVATADPVTWRLVLMPAEGAPEAARERIAEGRRRVVAQLAAAVAPGFVAGREVPDPELMALMLVTTADELVRLVLTQPSRYPVERVLAHAGWLLGQFEAGERG
jgi:AcrR family transcriptional regulator